MGSNWSRWLTCSRLEASSFSNLTPQPIVEVKVALRVETHRLVAGNEANSQVFGILRPGG